MAGTNIEVGNLYDIDRPGCRSCRAGSSRSSSTPRPCPICGSSCTQSTSRAVGTRRAGGGGGIDPEPGPRAAAVRPDRRVRVIPSPPESYEKFTADRWKSSDMTSPSGSTMVTRSPSCNLGSPTAGTSVIAGPGSARSSSRSSASCWTSSSSWRKSLSSTWRICSPRLVMQVASVGFDAGEAVVPGFLGEPDDLRVDPQVRLPAVGRAERSRPRPCRRGRRSALSMLISDPVGDSTVRVMVRLDTWAPWPFSTSRRVAAGAERGAVDDAGVDVPDRVVQAGDLGERRRSRGSSTATRASTPSRSPRRWGRGPG